MGATVTLRDEHAERCVIGALLIHRDVGEILEYVHPNDFAREQHRRLLATIVDLHAQGRRWDERSALNECAARGEPIEAIDVMDCMAAYSGTWRDHAARVVDLRARRQAQVLLAEASERVTDPTVDIGDAIAGTVSDLASIHTGNTEPPLDLTTLDSAARRDIDERPWVLPGLMRKGHRAILVGGEGSGKSVLLRQMTALAAAGIHPLHFDPITPICCLLVDLENPEDVVTTGVRRLVNKLDAFKPDRDKALSWVWERPGGIDLRSRRHRDELDAICSRIQPDLVCLGPLYKAYSGQPRESDEQTVLAVQRVFDDLRTRHGFALVLEHHAPHAEGSGTRTIRPFGSSVWLRWPEFGIGLDSDKQRQRSVLHLTRWRGDRVEADWPKRIERGSFDEWPWVGRWNDA